MIINNLTGRNHPTVSSWTEHVYGRTLYACARINGLVTICTQQFSWLALHVFSLTASLCVLLNNCFIEFNAEFCSSSKSRWPVKMKQFSSPTCVSVGGWVFPRKPCFQNLFACASFCCIFYSLQSSLRFGSARKTSNCTQLTKHKYGSYHLVPRHKRLYQEESNRPLDALSKVEGQTYLLFSSQTLKTLVASLFNKGIHKGTSNDSCVSAFQRKFITEFYYVSQITRTAYTSFKSKPFTNQIKSPYSRGVKKIKGWLDWTWDGDVLLPIRYYCCAHHCTWLRPKRLNEISSLRCCQ